MKKALVLSGGASRGAYQAGVIESLYKAGKTYDIFCGVSVGAINAVHLASYKDSEAQEMLTKLISLWDTIDTKNVYKNWKIPYVAGLWRTSLTNSSPLRDFLEKHLDAERLKASGKRLSIGAVSLTTEKYTLFTEKALKPIDAVLASSAYPVFMTPIEIKDELFTDGGAREVTPLKAAIDLGADEIDVIMCSSKAPPPPLKKGTKTLAIAERTLDIMSNEIIENDIKIAMLYNEILALKPLPGKRIIKINIIRPDRPLPGSALSFDNKSIREMMAIGRKDGDALI